MDEATGQAEVDNTDIITGVGIPSEDAYEPQKSEESQGRHHASDEESGFVMPSPTEE
jgi:hypothetical protein